MARIVLIGPGAIGGTVAGGLMSTGRHDLTICANKPFNTLTVKRADGSEAWPYPAHVMTSPSEVFAADWVLLAVKSHQTRSAAAWLRAAVGPDTKLAVLQNGVEHRERVAPFIPASAQVLPIVVQLPAQRVAPGEIVTYGQALLIAADDELGRAFAALFEGSPVKVSLAGDFKTAAWEKLCLNASSGSLTTLTNDPDAISRSDEMRVLAEAIIAECVAVGRTEGARFADDYAVSLANTLASRKGNRGNSMFYDRRDGNPLEYDARNAVIGRLGRKHGVATPVSDAIITLLAAISAKA